MTHSICTSGAGGGLPYFQRLWRTLLAPQPDPRTKLEQLFVHETGEFGLDLAFLAHIDLKNETERFEIVHGSHEDLKRGTSVPLCKTYCRKTIADPEGTLAVSDALAEGWGDDPAYETYELGSYLGTTVLVDDEVYGTLCFADTDPRDEPITDREKTLVEMYGQWVEYTLTLWGGPPSWRTGTDVIQDCVVSSEDIDVMMDALRKRTRREILLALLQDDTETKLATLVRRLEDENAHLRLVHSDLPRLAKAGYIRWDADSELITKGSKFSEVEPLVQLLKEYNASYSK